MTELTTDTAARRRLSGSPWAWIPTLYIAEGLPYFVVNTLVVILLTNMGIGLAEMAFYTGWLYLPWVIKPFWSPFVDIIGTKRGWVLVMQLCIAIALAAVALLLPFSFWFTGCLIVFWLMAFFSATHDIAADGFYMLALTDHEQAAFVGVRSTFYRIASVIGQGGLVYIAGELEERTGGDIPLAWTIVFAGTSAVFFAITLWHLFALPRPAADRPSRVRTAGDICREFGATFVTFFRKPHIGTALLFMLLYRLPEALMLKVAVPFMLADRAAGGLALTTKQVGVINGTFGVIALLLGGIVGGLCIARQGLKFWLWPMVLALTLPCGFYCYMAWAQPTSAVWVTALISVEQFGYGFGFTAFMLYLIYFSAGEFKTSHYAFCTAFMALGMMLPGMVAGWIQEQLARVSVFSIGHPEGYLNFFIVVMAACLFSYLACALVKINPAFGKKQK